MTNNVRSFQQKIERSKKDPCIRTLYSKNNDGNLAFR